MTKLKYLLSSLDRNPIFVSGQNASEMDRRHFYTYKKSGWVESLGGGAFLKKGVRPSLMAGVNALQMQARAPFHIGGCFALDELHGVRHYARTELTIELFTSTSLRLPSWFQRLYKGDFKSVRTTFLPDDLGIQEMNVDGFPVRASMPERSFLEVLYSKSRSTVEAYQILELLPVLRPALLTELLSKCNSVRVKRLFFYLAARLNYPWFMKIDRGAINLGSGVRVIDKSGSFDKDFNLVVLPVEEAV